MAFITRKCVTCSEPTKRKAGEYSGSDQQGKYRGDLFICDRTWCEVRQGNFFVGSGRMKKRVERNNAERSAEGGGI